MLGIAFAKTNSSKPQPQSHCSSEQSPVLHEEMPFCAMIAWSCRVQRPASACYVLEVRLSGGHCGCMWQSLAASRVAFDSLLPLLRQKQEQSNTGAPAFGRADNASELEGRARSFSEPRKLQIELQHDHNMRLGELRACAFSKTRAIVCHGLFLLNRRAGDSVGSRDPSGENESQPSQFLLSSQAHSTPCPCPQKRSRLLSPEFGQETLPFASRL